MRVGVAWYPEWCSPSEWTRDARKMRELGVSLVRVGEFAWSRMEPREGRFQFEWLDQALETLYAEGVDVVLGTPTSAPPNWLIRKYPDAYLVTEQMQPRWEGIRGHRCVNSHSFMARSRVIVEAMARRYARNPAVIGWQIDNELEMTLCNCPGCEEGFREWLRGRYGSLDALNEAWGTVVWSGEYSDWEEVRTPRGGKRQLNPSFQLDYHRFQNESIVRYQQVQLDILRGLCPSHFVTHNMWEDPLPIDYRALFAPLDFAATDYYVSPRPSSPYSGAYFLDQTRGWKRKPFWIMETVSGAGGGGCWGPEGRIAPTGFMRAVMWQAISRGADTVVNFLWRGPTFGSEQMGPGIMGHANRPPERRIREYAQACAEINRLSADLDGTTVRAEAAFLYSPEDRRAFQIQPQVEGGLDYDRMQKHLHAAMNRSGIGTDVIGWADPLDGYRLVVAAYAFLMDEERARTLERFVRDGGTLIITNRSGIKTMTNLVWPLQVPGLLAELAGVVVEEWDPLGTDAQRIRAADGKTGTSTGWADLVTPVSAQPLAWYQDGFYAGTPAITVNPFGAGRAYYLGTNPDAEYLKAFFARIADEAGVPRVPDVPEGVHASVRENDRERFLFLASFLRTACAVPLSGGWVPLLGCRAADGSVELEPFGVAILKAAIR